MTVDIPRLMQDVVHAHAVGFVTLNKGGPGLPSSSAGSGTLIEYLGVRGILTAAHVADALAGKQQFGIVRFQPGDKPGGMRCAGHSLEVTRIGGPGYGPEGPDIAFIRLPPEIEDRIGAESAFFNATVRARAQLAGVNRGNHKATFLTGVVAELSRDLGTHGNLAQVEHATLIGTGEIGGPMTVVDGIDTMRFKMWHNAEFPPPSTYEGVSGGGLWQLNDAEGAVGRTLVGVAYWEGQADADGGRLIHCHGPKAIHDTLCQKVLDRYDPDLGRAFREADVGD